MTHRVLPDLRGTEAPHPAPKAAARSARAMAMAAAVLVGAGAAPAAAQGALPVMTTAEEQAAWPMIGRINVKGIGSRKMCTGTLIAPDRVLTAAHCLVAPGGRSRPAPEDVVFVAGWRQGEWVADRAGAALEIHPGADLASPASLAGVATDLAVLRLAEPIPADVARPLPTGPLPAPPGLVSILGYRFDRPHALSRQAACRVLAQAGGAFATDCAVVPGSSGAPVIAQTPDGPRVVGVVSASTRNGAVRSLIAGLALWPE